jgi:hypothetical protein
MKKAFIAAFVALFAFAGLAQAITVTTIYDIQQDTFALGDTLTIEGVVVTAIDDQPNGLGFWCEELGAGPHSGIYIFTGVIDVPTVVIGDIVDVTGVYDEYYGLAELILTPDYGGWGSYTVVGAGSPPEPELLRAWQCRTSNPLEAEQWESVLVRVENVTALALDPGYGEWFAEEFGYAVNDTVRCDDGAGISGPPAGTEMTSITGILHFSYDDFKIEPRAEYDIVYSGAAPAPNLEWAVVTDETHVNAYFDREVEQTTAENAFNYFLDLGVVLTATRDAVDLQLVHLELAAPMTPEILLTLTVLNVQNTDGIPMTPQATQFWGGINTVAFAQTPDAGGDSSMVAGQVITIEGVVHSLYDVWGNHVYLQDVGSAPGDMFNGIEVYLSSYIDTLNVGDVLRIGDLLAEYFNMTSMSQSFYHFEQTGEGAAVLPPEPMTIGDMTDPGTFEPYEGMLVEVENVVVVERAGEWNFYEWAVTSDNLNWLRIDDLGDFDYVEGLGDTLNIRGTLRYLYGEFKLAPRSDADIDIIYQNPNGTDGLPAGVKISLAQNHPNPFNPRTKINFQLAKAGHATVDVFDAQGRRIKSLFSGTLDEGSHELIWNGDTDGGNQAATGLYFYKLRSAGESQTRKMLLLK